MPLEPGHELERKPFDWIPWRVRIALGHVLGVLAVAAALFYFRGERPSYWEVGYMLFTAIVTGVFGERGVRRSPWGVRSRLRSLFRESAQPDLVAITEVLSEAGESRHFERHRQAVDRFMRGMISEREFYAAMRELAA